MKYLLWAIGIALGLGLLIFGVSYPLLQSKEMAEGFAAIPIVGSNHIAEMLERQAARQSLSPNQPTSLKTPHGFEMPWYLLAVYGTIVLVAVVQLAGGLAGLIVGIASQGHSDMQNMLPAVAILSIPTQLIGGYYVGRWIGTRSEAKRGVMTVVACSALAAIITRAIDISVVSGPDAPALYQNMNAGTFLYFCLISFAIFAASALLGYWRGTKIRLYKYMQYLLGVLPLGTRSTLVDLAYEEAEKAGTSHVASAAPASP
ncbi:MAG TPA: hypothetical protein VHW02_00150 [Rhizomicrobium sp.]|jgi:hypothetical protein|nr:hypothetical protein [Rhizomicrobium sp.]